MCPEIAVTKIEVRPLCRGGRAGVERGVDRHLTDVDPAVDGVTCHVSYFDRSVLDRLRQGNWFENPSNSAVSCQRIGPIDLSGVDTSRAGEEIFNQRQSLFFKNVAVRRIVDARNRSLLYVSHSREIIEGSAKLDISSIALTAEEVATAQP